MTWESIEQRIKRLDEQIYYKHNPKRAIDLDIYLVFITCFSILVILSILLFWRYESVKIDNVETMFFELAFAFTGGYILAYWFFNKDRGKKKYSEFKFLDAVTDTFSILTTMSPNDDLDFHSFWRARYYCDLAKGYLKDYDSSRIDDFLKLDQCRDLINEKYERYKKLHESQDVIILTKEEALAITNEGNKIGLIFRKRLETYWPRVEFRLKRKKFLNLKIS